MLETSGVLVLRDVHHRYGPTRALGGATLTVAAGECVALLGPNGAGKTTLVGLATGLLARQQGEVRVAGGDPRRAVTRRHLGVVQQHAGFPRTLRVRELVRGAAVRARVPADAAERAMEELRIADLARRMARSLSGGQQRRVQLAMALVASPALLLLDEPTTGLDVTARRALLAAIAARRDAGAGVLLTTHLVEEAAAIADRVVVLNQGEVLASDTPAGLVDRLPDRTVSARTLLDAAAVAALVPDATVQVDDGRLRLATPRPEAAVRALLDADPALADLRVEGASLEEALVRLTTTTTEVAA